MYVMYVRVYVCMNALCMHVVFTNVCMHVCMFVCMHVCMPVLYVLTVLRGLVGGRLGRKLVQLARRHARVDPRDDLLSDEDGLHILGVEAVAEVADPSRDLVERHGLLPAVALHHEHAALFRCYLDAHLAPVLTPVLP